MKNAAALERENEALRKRLSRLKEVSLRINESVDFDGVLQEVVNSACALTSAQYGGLTRLDDSGQLDHFFASGLTPEQRRESDTLEGQIFEHFSKMQEPLRGEDLVCYVKSLG